MNERKSGGRPPLPQDRRRLVVVGIRVTAAEADAAYAHARHAGVPLSDLLRARCADLFEFPSNGNVVRP